MNQLPRADELDDEHVERAPHRAARVGAEAVEQALREDKVEIGLYINGRIINTKTDAATVHQVLAILIGLGG